jgi:integrase/recombinase XerD
MSATSSAGKKPGPQKGTRYRAKPGPVKGKQYTPKTDSLAGLPLTRYMEDHCEWMAITNYTPATVKARRQVMRKFIMWCDDRGLSDPKEITRPILQRYRRHLYYYRKSNGAPLSIGSQLAHLTPLKTFFKWLANENHILWNPAADLELPSQPKRLPSVIPSVEEVEAILRAVDHSDPRSLRDRAMLELLYSTGIRRSECAGIRLHEADLSRMTVLVHGKGQKDRYVPLGDRAALWLDKYLVQSRPLLAEEETETLFVTDYGEAVTPDFVASRVNLAMEVAEFQKPGSCHLFRHACATHMLDNGADIRFIQTLLGHESLSSTERYTHVAIGKLQEVHAATHPARLTRPAVPKKLTPEKQAAKRALLEILLAEDEEPRDS